MTTFIGTPVTVGSTNYITLQQFLDYQRITSTDTTDDGVINIDIPAACRWIDRETLTNFYGKTETHLFNIPNNFAATVTDIPLIELDDWLISVTTLTNGDSTVIPTASYYLLPANRTPKYSIGLRPAIGTSWQPTAAGDNIQVISVAGVWGYATSAPEDIQAATLEICAALYSRRFGTNMMMKTITTPAGIIQVPEGVPDWAAQVIGNYRKIFT